MGRRVRDAARPLRGELDGEHPGVRLSGLRRLTPDDWRAWRDLRLEGLADTPIGFGRTLVQEQALTEADWRAELGREGVRVQAPADGEPVAQAGGFPGGFPGRAVPDRAVTVYGVFVRPAHRGRGLLALLLDEVEAWAGEQGLGPTRLDVHEDNARARRAYERLGFVLDGTSAPYPPDPARRLLGMRRRRPGRRAPLTQ